MSNIVFISRHKAFSFQSVIGGGAVAPSAIACDTWNTPSFTRYTPDLTACGPPSGVAFGVGNDRSVTYEIGATKWLPLGSGMAVSSGLDAQLHTANSNLTLSNRGCRARYDYYYWQGRDIWRYDSRIETSGSIGSFNTFSQWTIDATPITTLVNGTTLGLYPMLIGSGNLNQQVPYLCTAAFDGSNVHRIRKNLITGTWESGIIGTLTSPGNGIPISEVFHNNSIYFVTDQDDRIGVINFDYDSLSEFQWTEEVRHPMDLNTFRGRVYCLNKTASNSGLGLWEVDAATGPSKVLQLAENLGSTMTQNNFHGRNLLFTCTVPNPITGNKPHMVAMNYSDYFVPASGTSGSGMEVRYVVESGNGNLRTFGEDLTGKNPNLLCDEWAFGGGSRNFFRVNPFSPNTVGVTENMMWRAWVDDKGIPESGVPVINIIVRENGEDGACHRHYQYRNTPNEDKMNLVGVTEGGGDGFVEELQGNTSMSYVTASFGGGHYDATGHLFDVTVSGLEDLPSGKTRVWYLVDGDYYYGNGHELKVTLRYGGQGDSLSIPHVNVATVDNAISGSIVNNELFIGLASGVPQYIDWNTQADELTHRAKTNFVVVAEATGIVPRYGAGTKIVTGTVRKMSPVVYAAINAEAFTFPTGPTAFGRFQNQDPAFETFSTGPTAYGRLTQDRVLDFTISTGPAASSPFINIDPPFGTFSTGPSTPIGSGVFIFSGPPGPVPTGINRPIWWGFRTSERRISGFGRAQGI